MLGYVFNPVSFWFCHRRNGELRAIVCEVNNTFGGRHSYVIPVEGGDGQSCPKRLYVSPFNAVEGHYGFRFSVPGERMALGVSLATGQSIDDVLNSMDSAWGA